MRKNKVSSRRKVARESARKEDFVKAFLQFSPMLDENNIEVRTATGYVGPVTEITVSGSSFWVLTEEEAYREATASFLEHVDGYMIEHDPDLNMTAELPWVLDYEVIRDMYMDDDNSDFEDEDDFGESRDEDPDDDDLHDWARDNFSNAEMWKNGMIDREKFCEHLWEVYGYGLELDMEQHNESEIVNGQTFFIFLRDGEWEALESRLCTKKRSRFREAARQKRESVSISYTGFTREIQELDKALTSAGFPVEITLSDDGVADFMMNGTECNVVISARNGHGVKDRVYDICAWHYPKKGRPYTYLGPSDLIIGKTSGKKLCEIVLDLAKP